MAETSPPALVVRDFRKNFDRVVAVDGFSVDLFPGDIVALVGPNGAGKTTTMRAISGIVSPTSGAIAINGHDLKLDPIAAKAALAYVPDDPKLFDTMTVWEHFQFVASAYRVKDWRPIVEELLGVFELAEKRTALAMELSRGMRQKVAIICAYLHSPAVILLDEPLTGLDPAGIRAMKSSIKDRAQAGAAVVLSSHLLSLVEDLCTRVLIMSKGRVRFSGTIDEARRQFAAGNSEASLEDVFFSATREHAPTEGTATAEQGQ